MIIIIIPYCYEVGQHVLVGFYDGAFGVLSVWGHLEILSVFDKTFCVCYINCKTNHIMVEIYMIKKM